MTDWRMITVQDYCSIFICAILAYGIFKRHERVLHVRVMSVAFALDLTLVIWLEFSREAVEKALALGGRDRPGPLLAVHITFAVLTIVCYLIQIYFGRKLLRGDESIRVKHRAGAAVFVFCRMANLVTGLAI